MTILLTQQRGVLHSPKLQHYWNHTIRFLVSYPGHPFLTPQQRCSWCILQPQLADILWTPTLWHVSVGRLAKIYIHHLCVDTGCCLENLSRAIVNMDRRRKRFRGVHAVSKPWWWWGWWRSSLLGLFSLQNCCMSVHIVFIVEGNGLIGVFLTILLKYIYIYIYIYTHTHTYLYFFGAKLSWYFCSGHLDFLLYVNKDVRFINNFLLY